MCMWTKSTFLCIALIVLSGGAADQCTPPQNQNGVEYDVELAIDKKNNPWRYDDIPDHLQHPSIGTPWPKIGDFARVYWNPATDRYYIKKAINSFDLSTVGFDPNWRVFEGWEVKLVVAADTYVIYKSITVSYDPLEIALILVPQKNSPYGYWDDANQVWVGLDYIGELEIKDK